MVGRRLAATLGLMVALHAAAQTYAPGDTTYEYPNKGTYYHDRFHGRRTSSGEVFDQNKFTAAHWKIKLGTLVMVTNRNTGEQVIVKVNDRCPKHGVLDLSHRAALAVGIRGMQPVTVRQLPPGYEARWAAQEAMFDSVAVGGGAQGQRVAKAGGAQGQGAATAAKAQPTSQPHTAADGAADGKMYSLSLGLAPNHGAAYNMILQLPEHYQDKVTVEPAADDGQLELTLDVRLDRNRAEQLCRALRHTFQSATLKEAE